MRHPDFPSEFVAETKQQALRMYEKGWRYDDSAEEAGPDTDLLEVSWLIHGPYPKHVETRTGVRYQIADPRKVAAITEMKLEASTRRTRELSEHLTNPTRLAPVEVVSIQTCWEQGRQSQQEGRSLVDSPYREETPEDRAWLHGFALLPCPAPGPPPFLSEADLRRVRADDDRWDQARALAGIPPRPRHRGTDNTGPR
jgi:hypothetical protein